MQIATPPALSPSPKPASVQPSAQAALQPTAVAANATARTAATQTAQAPQATARPDSGRRAQSGTDTGQAKDTQANALAARSQSPATAAKQPRGSLLDLRV